MWQFQPLSNPIFSENTRDRNSFSLLKCTNRMHARSNCSISWTCIKRIMQNNFLDWTIVRCEILVVVTIKYVILWDVIPCSLVMYYKQSIEHNRVAQSVQQLSYRLDGTGLNPGGDEIFCPSRSALGPTQPHVKWVPGLSQGWSVARTCCWPLTPF